MANEGIMALPQGMDMPADQAQNQAPVVTSADSYDAAQTALGMTDPQGSEAAKAAIREAIGDLQLTPEQLDMMIQMFEYMSQNPGEYKRLVQQLVDEGAVDPGDFPEEYDAEFVGMVLIVLNEMRMMQGQGAMEPMAMSPVVQGLEPMTMADGGLADVAAYLAAQGRNGDTMLAHITPEEAQLLKERGGSGTINPVTGLPEFFLKKVFKAIGSAVKSVVNVVKKALQSPVGRILGTIALATVLGPTAVGAFLGPAGTAALASGTTTLLAGGNLKEALVAGAMGYVGAGGTVMGANPMTAVGKYLPGLEGSALNTGLSTGLIGAGIGKLGGMSTQDALRMGMMSGASAAALQGFKNNTGLMNEGRVTQDDIRQSAMENFRRGEITAQNAVPTGAPGPIGTASDLMSPVEVTGTAQAGRFIPDAPQGMSNYPQVMAYRAAQENDLVRLANLQDTYGDRITGRYSYATPGRVDTSPIPTAEPLGRFAAPVEPAGMAGPSAGVTPSGGFAANYSLAGGPSAAPAGMEGAMGSGLRAGVGPLSGAPGMGDAMGSGLRASISPAMTPEGVANYGLSSAPAPAAPAPAAPAGFLDKMVTGAKDIYNEYLSPSRPGLPADAGVFQKYGPLAAAGTGIMALSGGMQGSPSNPNPVFNRNYTGLDYMRDNPNMFQGGLDFSYQRPTTPQSPVVQTDFSRSIPISGPGQVMPGGVTMSPAGVAQPYNMAGLYGVPMIYPVNRAQGGEMAMTQFPRKNGPINGPGTGTSDSIPAMLSDGEFVFTAKAVRNAGGGSRRKGAARMYKLMKKLEGGPVKG